MMSPAGQQPAPTPDSRLDSVNKKLTYHRDSLNSVKSRLARFGDRMTGPEPTPFNETNASKALANAPVARPLVSDLEVAADDIGALLDGIFAQLDRIDRI